MGKGVGDVEILRKISKNYHLQGEIKDYTTCVNGHINDTYRVIYQTPKNTYEEYIFQRINGYVFEEPQKVMHNIKEITKHVEVKKTDDDCDIISFLDNKDGVNYTLHENEFWRVCHFVKDSVTFDTAEDPKVLRSAGYAFGRFQDLLSDFPMDKLYNTIPDFHNTKKRLNDFFEVVELDPFGRVKDVEKDIRFFEKHRALASKLIDMQEAGTLPLRVTHNDTKYNNILMHKETMEPLCVIDLDTVMPGLTMYDFGDAIRFAANTAVEDEVDLSKVALNMENYEAFTKGFLSAAKGFLTKSELDNMALGAVIITIELASRFLADHINGDQYFRIHRENHNLERARCQIKLAEEMLKNYEEMCATVERYSS